MSKARRAKWLFNIANLFSAIGIAFLIVDELSAYKPFAITILIIGVALYVVSNFYRERKGRQ